MLFDRHVNEGTRKAVGTLMYINSISVSLDKPFWIIVVQRLVLTIINYCLPIWGTANITVINDVQKLQNFDARVAIGGIRKYDHITPPLKEQWWLEVNKKTYIWHYQTLLRHYSDITRHYSDITQTLLDITQTLPDITQTLPDITQTLPDITQTLPDITQTLPDITQTLSDITRHYSGITQTLLRHYQTLLRHYSDITRHYSDIT